MARFEHYRDKYRHLRMQRNDGILEVTLHSDDGPVVWGAGPLSRQQWLPLPSHHRQRRQRQSPRRPS